MLQYEAGKNFQDGTPGTAGVRREASRGPIRVVVLDPILASRFLLAQAVSQPGFLVETAATIEAALKLLDRHEVSLLLCDERLEEGHGLDFLADLRETHPDTLRALVAERAGFGFDRRAIERGGLCFLLSKPWSAASLRRTVREVLGVRSDLADWIRVPMASERDDRRADPPLEGLPLSSEHRVVLRGLLAGFDTCESQADVFGLLRAELAAPFRLGAWFWLDESSGLVTRFESDASVATTLPGTALSPSEQRAIARARRSRRVACLDETDALGEFPARRGAARVAWVGMQICEDSQPVATGVVSVGSAKARDLVSMLRELEVALQRTTARIRGAEVRAELARGLAERVSQELRTPMGALTHAIDRLRGEAQRAGMSTEWIDRVACESERVARVVAHLEGELLVDPSRMAPSSI